MSAPPGYLLYWRQGTVLARAVRTRFTADPGREYGPVWSPDGRRLAYVAVRVGNAQLVSRDVQGGPERVLLTSPLWIEAVDWSPDGRFILYEAFSPGHRTDLLLWPVAGGKPTPLAATGFQEDSGRFSPDGRWVAYVSDETGRMEIFVQPFPPTGTKWLASTGGGRSPRWSADGRVLHFIDAQRQLVAVDFGAAAEPMLAPPRKPSASAVQLAHRRRRHERDRRMCPCLLDPPLAAHRPRVDSRAPSRGAAPRPSRRGRRWAASHPPPAAS